MKVLKRAACAAVLLLCVCKVSLSEYPKDIPRMYFSDLGICYQMYQEDCYSLLSTSFSDSLILKSIILGISVRYSENVLFKFGNWDQMYQGDFNSLLGTSVPGSGIEKILKYC